MMASLFKKQTSAERMSGSVELSRNDHLQLEKTPLKAPKKAAERRQSENAGLIVKALNQIENLKDGPLR